MSDKSNPFGSGGERTVVTPNPGGRRPPAQTPPAQPGAPPPQANPFGQGTPYTPSTAPAYMPQNQPPQPTSTPYGQGPSTSSPYALPPGQAYHSPTPYPPTPGMGAPPYGSPPRPDTSEEWISTPAARRPDPTASFQRAEDLRFDELVAENENPIMRAAGPLLLLLGRLRVAMLRASFASLMEQVAAAINFFDTDIRTAGIPPQQANVAKYIICATADDIVQNIPTEDRHVWTQYSMLSRFFGERVGGVRFFDELDRLKQEPAVNYNVLELQHACLALGFQGVHRTSAGGAAQLQLIQRDLYELLRRIRPRTTHDLSLRWKGQALAVKNSRWRVPVWAIAGLAALALFGMFILLRTWLAGHGEAVAAEVVDLHPVQKITLQRRLPSPPPPPPPPTPQIQRICDALKPEIDAGTISCVPQGQWIAIRVGNIILFESGKADVLPQFIPVAKRIAILLEKEAGPVKIVGHTDNQPLSPVNPFKDNQQLSVARAKAVAAIIRPALSQPDRISLEGHGPDEPIADNKTDAGKARNRRVEILVTRVE